MGPPHSSPAPQQNGCSAPTEPSHVSPSPGFRLPNGFCQPYPFMTPFPKLPPHPGACASLLGAWEKPPCLFKPDREGVSRLGEDVERLFLPCSGQTASVLHTGPYRKCKSCHLFLPWTGPKSDSPEGTHGDLTARGWWAPIRPSLLLWPQGSPTSHHFLAAGKPEPLSIPALCFL